MPAPTGNSDWLEPLLGVKNMVYMYSPYKLPVWLIHLLPFYGIKLGVASGDTRYKNYIVAIIPGKYQYKCKRQVSHMMI